MNSGQVERALRNHIGFAEHLLIPEAGVKLYGPKGKYIGEYRADYMKVSPSGFCTEFEVKISRSDWKADLTKLKWTAMPGWVKQFIYVVPESLGIPEWVPPFAGVWFVKIRHGMMYIEVARTPKIIGKEKVPEAVKAKWLHNLYYRFWNMRVDRDDRLPRA